MLDARRNSMGRPSSRGAMLIATLTLGTGLLLEACGSPVELPTTGTLEVSTWTTGASLDADGYVVRIASGDEAIDLTATTTHALPPRPGGYEVELSGLAPNCTVPGPNPREVNVEVGRTSATTFFVSCSRVPRDVVFSSTRAGGVDIYAVGADGTFPVRLTASEEGTGPAAWSPDATQLGFVRGGELYVMASDGTSRRYVTGTYDPIVDLAWSPDGSRMMLTTNTWESWCDESITWIVRVNGTERTHLSSGHGTAWSPDGARVAVVRPSDPADLCSSTDIHVLDVDDPASSLVLAGGPASEGGAAWSPDGTKVAFESDREGDTEIYVMDADGSDLRRLTHDPAWDAQPAWSPDGTRIAFTSGRDGNAEIYLMDADGSNLVNLTNHPGMDSAPSWTPVAAPQSDPTRRRRQVVGKQR